MILKVRTEMDTNWKYMFLLLLLEMQYSSTWAVIFLCVSSTFVLSPSLVLPLNKSNNLKTSSLLVPQLVLSSSHTTETRNFWNLNFHATRSGETVRLQKPDCWDKEPNKMAAGLAECVLCFLCVCVSHLRPRIWGCRHCFVLLLLYICIF